MNNNILVDREKRYNEILSLLEEYKLTVLCGKVNYPGNNKNTEEVKIAFKILMNLLRKKFYLKLKHVRIINGDDGPAFIMVLDMSAIEAKRIAITIEDMNEIGRIFDIDIYTKDGSSLGRSDINMMARKCIICHEDGRVCTKLQKHDLSEVIDAFNKVIKKYGEMNDRVL